MLVYDLVMASKFKRKGWRFESARHSLSAKGIKTSKVMNSIKPLNLNSNRLPLQFGLIVPSTKDNDKKISSKEFEKRVDNTKSFFSKTFGGETSVKSEGGFVLNDKLIKEKTVIVESSTTTKSFNNNRKKLEDYVKNKQKSWKQNSLLFKIEGEDFIYPKQSFIDHDPKRKNINVS